MPARRDDDEACSQNQNAASRRPTRRPPRSSVVEAPGKTGFWSWARIPLLNKRITLDHLRRLNPRLFRWARFCCTSRWMSSFDSGDGFFLRPTFAVALTDLTSL